MKELYFAHYELGTGKILGWYNNKIHGVRGEDGLYNIEGLPSPNVEVSLEDWSIALEEGHTKVSASGKTSLEDFRPEEQKAHEDYKADRGDRRGRVKSSTVFYANNEYQTDDASLSLMATTVVALDAGEFIVWRLLNNEEVTLTREDLKSILKLGVVGRSLIMGEV